jgi:hypothetical protein
LERTTKFWTHVWLDKVPSRVSYHELFEIYSEPKAIVGDLVEEEEWLIQFRRALNGRLMESWNSLHDKLGEVNLTTEDDRVIVTPHVMTSLVTFIKILIKDQID